MGASAPREQMADADLPAMFERMYDAAAGGEGALPWDRGEPHPLLVAWADGLRGDGRRALVVGSGTGDDAEFVAGLGFDVVGFDVSPSAVATARRRFPDSTVDYGVADLFDLPAAWSRAFDLVVEILTVQSTPIAAHPAAIAAIAGTVAAGGTLIVIATARADDAQIPDGPPWPLARAEIDAFGAESLTADRIEVVREPGERPRYRAVFGRSR